MKVIWLGQNGLLFVSGRNKILVDPYLSDSLRDIDIRMVRGWKINKKLYTIDPNVIVLTNSHMDHTDIVSLKNYIEKNRIPITILCSESAFDIINTSGIVGRYNNVMLRHGSEWTHDNLVIKSVPASTDDKGAMGVIITDETDDKKYYIASDTLYNESIFATLPKDIDTLFVPINGEDGSMNVYDAMRFARAIDAVHSVPVHFGMFDDVDPKLFVCDGSVIPEIYKVIPLVDNERTELKKLSLKKVFACEEKEMKELKKAQGVEVDVQECNEKTDTYEQIEDVISENTVKIEEIVSEPAPIVENVYIEEECSPIIEEMEEPFAAEVCACSEEQIIDEAPAECVCEEKNDEDNYIFDESSETVEIDTVENELAYMTLDAISLEAEDTENVCNNADDCEIVSEPDEEYEVEEYDEEYIAPSFDSFEPLSPDEYVVDPDPDDFSSTGELEMKSPEDVVEFASPDMIEDAVLVEDYEEDAEDVAAIFSDEYGIEDVATLDGADNFEVEFDSVPDFFEEEEIDADTELMYSSDDEPSDNTADSLDDYDEEDLSSKIDAYVKEIEKFERGDTADFSIPDFDN